MLCYVSCIVLYCVNSKLPLLNIPPSFGASLGDMYAESGPWRKSRKLGKHSVVVLPYFFFSLLLC